VEEVGWVSVLEATFAAFGDSGAEGAGDNDLVYLVSLGRETGRRGLRTAYIIGMFLQESSLAR
jgi:hypothetical protein